VTAAAQPPTEQPEFTVVRTEDLGEDERAAIIALCNDAFAAYDEPSDFRLLFQLVPPGSTHVLMRLAGQLAGHACWETRWLQPGDRPPLRTAYVEAVCVAPAHQGRGLGSALMERVAAEIVECGDFELAALSPARPSFYRRLGWEPWIGPLAIRSEQGLDPTPDDECVLILRLPRTPDLDLTALLTAEWRPGEPW
jgi:aminoglycoside 2'-N-acetyltransferase I